MRPLNRSDLPVLQTAFESAIRGDENRGEAFGGQKFVDAACTIEWDDSTDATALVRASTTIGQGQCLVNPMSIFWPGNRPLAPADVVDAVGTAIASAVEVANQG